MQSKQRVLQNKMNMLHCVLKGQNTRNKNLHLVNRHFKSSDDLFDTTTLNLDVSSFFPCVINLLHD